MKLPLDWLMEGPAWVRHRALLDLCGKDAGAPEVKAAYREALADPRVAALVDAVNGWADQRVITRHNDAVHPLHQLVFAADLGLKRRDLKPGVDAVLAHRSEEGPFQVRISIPKAFGGDDVPRWSWVATDAPLVVFALLRLGVRSAAVRRAAEHLRGRIAEPGYPCFASPLLGRFRGPGRKADPCPYANLIVLRMLAEVPALAASPEAERAADMLLWHWETRGARKLYHFGIGTDFEKPKAPLVWYDVLHFVDVLTRVPAARGDPRLAEVLARLAARADGEGRFTSASVWAKWKGWEFCQKREPSRWVTLLAHRALRRAAA